ncbi:MAG: VOC family protein [Ornithinimicrobium sp.]
MSESTVTTRTHQMIFVNLPVKDPAASREFFTTLGYGFDEEMCNDEALALELGTNHYAMLLQTEFFGQFHDAQVAQPGHHEVLTCLSADSRDDVDDLVGRAVQAGGRHVRTEEYGDFMYGRSFADLDGHIWEIMWMDVERARAAGSVG